VIRLGLNIDHVATLRQQRGGLVAYPDILEAAKVGLKGGADQITIHLRGDRRHIQDGDLQILSKNKIPLNFEMAVTEEMIGFALEYKPEIVCLVPEKREELTTEGGLDVLKNSDGIRKAILKFKKENIRTSLFIEANTEQIKESQSVGADAVEFHTGHYSHLKDAKKVDGEFEKLNTGCILAHDLGLHVHAGHGLDYKNVKRIVTLPHLEELNIGHAIVCRSVFVGLESAVKEMKALLK
jgi:pyridoxine 5-phosphate synthase